MTSALRVRLWILPLLVAAGLGAGCEGRVGANEALGDLRVVENPGPNAREVREVLLDFGDSFAGVPTTRPIVVKNVGQEAIVLRSLERLSGDPVQFDGTRPEGAAWEVAFASGAPVGPGESVEIPAWFLAPVEDSALRPHEVVLRLSADGAPEGADTATITLRARTVPVNCRVPEVLDFGSVTLAESWDESIELRNDGTLPITATIGVLGSDSEPSAFTFVDPPPTQIELGPGASKTIALRFRPLREGQHLGALMVRPAELCAEQPISLVGRGVQSVFSWTPPRVDFGLVPPGIEAVRDLTFQNAGNVDIQLSNIRVTNNTEFRIVASEGVDPTRATIPARGGVGVVKVAARPIGAVTRTAFLRFDTDLSSIPSAQIDVTVDGGGPEIELSTTAMDFGRAAYFASATGPAMRRTLRVKNGGAAPASAAAQAALRLGEFRIAPKNTATLASEFAVELPATYDAAKGIALNGETDLRIAFQPSSLGLKEAELTIVSNDASDPEVKVALRAEAISLPPCQYSVKPSALDFGLVPPPETRERIVSVKNVGTGAGDTCLFYGGAISPGSSPHFAVAPEFAETTHELAPGGTIFVRAHARPRMATPTADTSITGVLELSLSSPTEPTSEILLSATVGPMCLLVAPAAYDFGTVQVGCSSATRTFNLYNRCATSLTIDGIRILSAATADPLCAAGVGCSFSVVGAPAIPAGGLAIGETSPAIPVQVKFRPGANRLEFDSMAIDFTEDGATRTLLVPLEGTGAPQGAQVDVYTLPSPPKADVVVVMDEKAPNYVLSPNSAAFLKYAIDNGVDFQLALNTAEPAHGGQFVYGPGHPERVLTESTSSLLQKWAVKAGYITLGVEEWAAAPALLALTPPLINSDHAGFIRPEASLGIVFAMSENDQSPRSSSYYLDAFVNLKGHNQKWRLWIGALAAFAGQCAVPDDGIMVSYVDATFGEAIEVCTAGSAEVERLGKGAFGGGRTAYPLNIVPDLVSGAVGVEIDGVPIAPMNGATQVWSYDALGNAVKFNPLYAPGPGQTLKVSYPVTCHP